MKGKNISDIQYIRYLFAFSFLLFVTELILAYSVSLRLRVLILDLCNKFDKTRLAPGLQGKLSHYFEINSCSWKNTSADLRASRNQCYKLSILRFRMFIAYCSLFLIRGGNEIWFLHKNFCCVFGTFPSVHLIEVCKNCAMFVND